MLIRLRMFPNGPKVRSNLKELKPDSYIVNSYISPTTYDALK